MALLNLLLAGTLLRQACRRWPDAGQQALFALPAIALCAAFYPHYWYRAVGEVTALLLLGNAAFLLAVRAGQPLPWKAVAIAGLCAGLAATSKSMALLACGGLAAALWVDWICMQRQRQSWRNWLLLCSAMCLPYALFTLYQAIAA